MKNSERHMTLTRRVAVRLEKRIYTGDYPPDSPLPSTRTLADQFGVSQRVILLALDILEQKNILVRQERKRVYVKARSLADDAREILFFAFGDSLGLHGIYQTLNEMILQTAKQRRYDFFSRVISSSGGLSDRRLDREVARLENLGFIDSALVYCFLNETQMGKFLHLPYPVIFIGELPDSGELPEGARMISPNSAGLLSAVARFASRKKYRMLALAYWQGPARHRYEQENLRKLQAYAAAHQLELQLIPVPGSDIRETAANFEKAVPEIFRSLPAKTLLAAHNIHSDRFDAGELLPAGLIGKVDMLTSTLPHEGCQIHYVHRDFSDLKRRIVEFIENPDAGKHVITDFKYQIITPSKGGKR